MRVSFPRVAPLVLAMSAAMSPLHAAVVDPGLRADAERMGSVSTLIVLEAKAPKQLLRSDGNYLERRRELVNMLRATAEITQTDLRVWLDAQGALPTAPSGSST
jgi:serine protease AprX